MTSLPKNQYLKFQATGASGSGENTPKPARKTVSFTKSSPPVLQPSRGESRTATRPLSQSPIETTPMVSNDQRDERGASQQMNGQGEESPTNCCSIINCYKNFAIKVRNSVFIYIVQLLFSTLPVSAVVMGVLFAEKCPTVHYLPVFGASVGAMEAIFIAIWIFVICSYRRGTPCSNRQTFLIGMLYFLTMVMIILDAVFVFSLSPSFDPTSAEFCNETFYTYAFYKEIATVVAVVVSAILYLPGSRHFWCCHDCSMRSPPSAFYVSI